MKEVPLFRRVLGLNNRVDEARLTHDIETGSIELSQANNITISDRGRPGRRPGQTELFTGDYHSVFCAGYDALVAENKTTATTLYKINADESLTSLTDTLSKGYKLAYCQINYQTYYSNTQEYGYVEGGVLNPWPVQTYQGADTRRTFTTTPIGKHIGFHAGRLLMSEDNVLWETEVFQFGLVDMEKGFLQTPEDIRMVAAVDSGIYVSDTKNTYFFTGTEMGNYTEKMVCPYPAHEYSLWPMPVDPHIFGFDFNEKCRVWSSTEGTCVGLPNGQVVNLTDKQIKYANELTKGATLLWDGPFGNQIIAHSY